MAVEQRARELALVAAQAASDKLAHNIVLLDVGEQLALTDVFCIFSAPNERQVASIVDGVEEALLARGAKPLRREGRREARWVLLDYGDIVVHIQHEAERAYYDLERLWKDCPRIPFDDGAPAQPAAGPAVTGVDPAGRPDGQFLPEDQLPAEQPGETAERRRPGPGE